MASPEQPKNYLLEAQINPIDSKRKKVQIIRTISVHATLTFHQLHVGLQLAFERDDEHAYHFKVKDCTEWRTMTQAESAEDLLQMCQFYLDPRCVLDDPRYAGRKILYEWGLAAICEHIITVKGRSEAANGTKLLSGKGKPSACGNVFSQRDMDTVNRRLDRHALNLDGKFWDFESPPTRAEYSDEDVADGYVEADIDGWPSTVSDTIEEAPRSLQSAEPTTSSEEPAPCVPISTLLNPELHGRMEAPLLQPRKKRPESNDW
ncbi:uncharacterized protein PAC_04792 [Phialocephala subalpina]|uniref:Plasmid pRiA4b Orf3-like domain-containing protein n=1 Tax=Phialocephala subalpina TaxID=576137 RepID=A0A1L7WQ73_9HELO|nr:uncharacterized protein PAC_04792 [Phialocephala subalpina]